MTLADPKEPGASGCSPPIRPQDSPNKIRVCPADKGIAMTIPSKPAPELLAAPLTTGNARTQCSFREALDRASCTQNRARLEELDALAGILEGLNRMSGPSKGKALEPTLRHLLTRVLWQ